MKKCKCRISGEIYYYALGEFYFSHGRCDVYKLYSNNNKSFYDRMIEKNNFNKCYIDLTKFERKEKLKKLNEKRTNRARN